MNARRLIVVFVLLFMFFLAIYTWNERTSKLDKISTNIGIEVVGAVVRSVTYVSTTVSDFWNNYISLVGVNEENQKLKEELFNLKRELASANEDKAELERLRKLLSIDYAVDWKAEGVRILAWRLGANDYFESFVLSKGFFSGSKVGTPIVNADGLIGRVLKAGPYTSIALLLTDSGSSVSVITEKGRVPGIVQGNGHNQLLSMRFVKKNEEVKVGERVLTSGLDLSFPKGIPVGEIVSVEESSNFMLEIQVRPLVNFEKLEEVLFLQNPFEHILPEGSPVYSPKPHSIFSPMATPYLVQNEEGDIDKAFDEQANANGAN